VDGTLCWADLATPDPDQAVRFYSCVFGWKFVPGEKDHSGYLHIRNGEDFIGGMPPARLNSGKVPAHWLPYFNVSDVKALAARAVQLGARIHVGPETMERVGTFAVIADPADAVFAIFKSARS
jgi:predicted enzyme related to lactoylglutathione lyase